MSDAPIGLQGGPRFEDRKHELLEMGLHVTTITVCGVTFAEAHEATDEARQAVIDRFNETLKGEQNDD